MSKGKVPHVIRVMDAAGEYVGLMPLSRCEQMAARGRLVITYNGRRTFAQSMQAVDDFDRTNQDRPIYHMAESHQGHCLVVLKRLHGERSYGTRWDPGLTFSELREGKLISNETKQIQAAARRNRARTEGDKAA